MAARRIEEGSGREARRGGRGRGRAGLLTVTAGLILGAVPAAAQTADGLEGTGLVPAGLLLRQMDGVKRVLMIGAHPDDEDTAFLTVLARDMGAETAYLSITRGDGGQNLIGPELWEGLGVIRTGELEAARRLDGGRQFFTRAFDFGYSKTAEEALTLWPHDEVLGDVVWVIRTFRPHVVVSVWTGTERDGHGQHTASGILAREGFAAAGDPSRYPEHRALGVEAWQPAKLYQTQRRDPTQSTVFLEAGQVDPLLGRSTYQLAMASRSQHRSQDMGALQPLGPRQTGASLEASRVEAVPGELFSGIDTALTALAARARSGQRAVVRQHLEQYRAALDRARAEFGLETGPLAAALAEAMGHVRAARQAAGERSDVELRRELDRRIDLTARAWSAAAGVVVDVRADDDLVTPGQEVTVRVHLWNGSGEALRDVDPELALPPGWVGDAVDVDGVDADGSVPPGALATWTVTVAVPPDAAPSRLYYLEEDREGAMYRWPGHAPHLWGLPRDPAVVDATVRFTVGASGRVVMERSAPWRYVGVDQARGEFERPVLVVPDLSVRVRPSALVWPLDRREATTVSVAVRSQASGPSTSTVRLHAPAGFRVTPSAHTVRLEGKGEERAVSFQVEPSGAMAAGEHRLAATATTEDGRRFEATVDLIDYEHIDRALMVSPAVARFTVVPVRIAEARRVGYIMGTGDEGPEALRQMGAQVTLLDPARVREGDFSAFDVLVLGVRAYESRADVLAANAAILDFARAGGTVIVQYNQYQFARGGYAPYPLDISRPHDRVADETAEVRVLRPEAPVFTTPNRIGPADFDGWVQERGLYFLGDFDSRYVPLLELNDPGEDPKRGGLVVAEVGEGLWVYTGLSFFRQWSSGVPGAYRLFANLVSLSPEEWRGYRESDAGR